MMSGAGSAYAELAVTTNYSFLRGASGPEEMVAAASTLNLAGLGIADRNSLAGVVRAHLFVRENKLHENGFQLAIGSRLVFCDGTPDILAYPKDRAAYAGLTRLLTRGNLRAEKGACLLRLDDLCEVAQGFQLAVMPATSFAEDEAESSGRLYADFAEPTEKRGLAPWGPPPDTIALLHRLGEATSRQVWLVASMIQGRNPRRNLAERAALAKKARVGLLASNDVLMHEVERRGLQDVLTCIRRGTTLEQAGRALEANAERHLKDAAAMLHLFAEAPAAVGETLRFLDGLDFSLEELKGDYPEELRQGFATPQEALRVFAYEGAAKRYPAGIPAQVQSQIEKELAFVDTKNYAAYFLTVHDIMRFARDNGILCQGRGSAANSTLCFCLWITEVDPAKTDLVFERFVSDNREEPPDIDVDFEHERREEVMQYIYERYGRARAALTATVVTYRSRSSIREVGKVFGFSDDMIAALSGTIWGGAGGGVQEKEVRRAGYDPTEPRLAKALSLATELVGFPRHLSQHTGGFVITHSRIDETMPIAHASMAERTTVEWDKDDLDALGILKVDILALGMLTCLQKGFALLDTYYGKKIGIPDIVQNDEKPVYDMISRADTIGVFQIESRAQMSMLPRLKPDKFYDLVIEVAIVRPGPIQGDMVHPYLRRRQKLEEVNYVKPELEAVLGKTLGVPLFQEQAMRIAIVAAGFTPSEADKLRRAMATFKRVGTIHTFFAKMVDGMEANGYPRDFAERCFKQIEGFGTYGFPESHAASFAILVYASAWMKCRYPDVFACALLNSQPLGFYAPAQIVRDAREHGVAILDVDVNFSDWDCTLVAPKQGAPDDSQARLHKRHADMQDAIFSTHALRLGLRQIGGANEETMKHLVAKRDRGYDSIRDLWLRTGLAPSVLEKLAEADAFRSIGLDRRDALWAVRGLNRAGDKDDLPLLKSLRFSAREPDADLPPMPLGEHVVEDYRHLTLSLKAHPVSFLRGTLDARRIVKAGDLIDLTPGPRVTVAGLVLVRQRPGSAKGVIFLTMEDETGVANAIVWPKIFEALRPIVMGARFISVSGRLQNEAGVIHVVVERAEDLTSLLGVLSQQAGNLPTLARADEVRRPILAPKPRPQAEAAQRDLFERELPNQEDPIATVMPRGRNFH